MPWLEFMPKPTIPSSVFFSQKSSMVDKNIYIVQGEISTVVGAIKRNSRWNTHTPLVSKTQQFHMLILTEFRLDLLKIWNMTGG